MEKKVKFEKGDTIALVACSNSISINKAYMVNNLKEILNEFGLKVKIANTIYSKDGVLNRIQEKKALELLNFFEDKNIKAIFDISGGDLANGLLEYIDFNVIKNNAKPFFGYSDVTVILNAIYSQSNIYTYLYQVRNLIDSNREEQIFNFVETFINEKNNMYNFQYTWVQNKRMEGEVVGGNIRCFLKLAGTKFMPAFKNKILFLESLSGNTERIKSYLTQYKNIGVFNEINGIILGTFSEMEKNKYNPNIEKIILEMIDNKNIPIAKTINIGHGDNSKCLVVGKKIILKD